MVKCLNIGTNIGKPIYRSISIHVAEKCVNVMCMDSFFFFTLASGPLIFASHKSNNSSKKTVKACVMLD